MYYRQFAEVIGQLVAAHAGVWIAPLFINRLETAKVVVPHQDEGNYDAVISQ